MQPCSHAVAAALCLLCLLHGAAALRTAGSQASGAGAELGDAVPREAAAGADAAGASGSAHSGSGFGDRANAEAVTGAGHGLLGGIHRSLRQGLRGLAEATVAANPDLGQAAFGSSGSGALPTNNGSCLHPPKANLDTTPYNCKKLEYVCVDR